jgi:RimJ/RimL family protein N-acetyltransferase
VSGSAPIGEPVSWQPVGRPAREPIIGTRVVLLPVDAARDAEPLYALSHPPAGDPSIWTYLPDGPYADEAELRRRLEQDERCEDPLFFTIASGSERRPLGRASYLRITPEHGVIEIGHIWFGPPLKRTAAATEAIYLLGRHAFDELGYRRLEWKCNARNAASRGAAERFGFRFEGVFRNHMVLKGHNRDTAWYAITDAEWPSVRSGFERWLATENFTPEGAQRRGLKELIAEAVRASGNPRPRA